MYLRKLIRNKAGFSLTEVMIGMMILTVAIVAATNLLVGLIGSNQTNLKTMQAYYLAQEGIEAVRNVRDSNWLHNNNWLGDESGAPWEGRLVAEGESFDLELLEGGWITVAAERVPGDDVTLRVLGDSAPWKISELVSENSGKIYDHGGEYWSSVAGSDENFTGFSRTISIKNYGDDSVLVEARVSWSEGAKERSFALSEVMTDWKGGAL